MLRGITIFVMVWCPCIFAQEAHYGRTSTASGLEHLVTFPRIKPASIEASFAQPYRLLISSEYETMVTVKGPVQSGFGSTVSYTGIVLPGSPIDLVVPSAYRNYEPGSIGANVISVTSQHPVSVLAYVGWNGNTITTRATPVETWGKEYLVSSLPQDAMRTFTDGTQFRAGYIVITASEDETSVTVQPTAKVVGGESFPTSMPGEAFTIEMQRGQTVCIEAATLDQSFVWSQATDLTGTFVKSNKPVSVLAGHMKSGMYQVPALDFTMVRRPDHFDRAPMAEYVPPLEHTGTTFVTAPLAYNYRSISLGEAIGDPYQVRGDVIRFVAVDAPITIRRNEGQNNQPVAKLTRRGEVFEAKIQERAAVWTSTGRVLASQYGKGIIYPYPPGLPEGQPAGLPTAGFSEHWFVGSPVLVGATPVSQWVNSATFSVPTELPTSVCIITTSDGVGSMKINNAGATSFLSSAFVSIPGTPYAYIRSRVSTNDLLITSPVKFTAMVYGHIEGLHADPFFSGELYTIVSHGQNSGFSSTTECEDTLLFQATDSCGVWTGSIRDSSKTKCSRIVQTYLLESKNVTLTSTKIDDQNLRFEATTILKTEPGSLVLRCRTSSGRFVDIPHTLASSAIQVLPDSLDLGLLPVNVSICRDVEVTNNATAPITVNGAAATNGRLVSMSPSAFIMVPGERRTVKLCVAFTEKGRSKLMIDLLNDCRIVSSIVFTGLAEIGDVEVTDQAWGDVPAASQGVELPVRIGNRGRVDVTILGYDSSAVGPNSNFSISRGIDGLLPLTLRPGQLHTFHVLYRPLGDTSSLGHVTELAFLTTTSVRDTVAVLTGRGVSEPVSISDSESHEHGVFLDVNGTDLYLHHPGGGNSIAHVSVYNVVGARLFASSQKIEAGSTVTRIDLPPGSSDVQFVVVEYQNVVLRTIRW